MVRQKLEEVDERIADMQKLKQDLRHLEAHFQGVAKEVEADHNMWKCSPETCTCLGVDDGNQNHSEEMMLWQDKQKSKS